MAEAQPWSFFGLYNGFRFCIPEITEAALIANYGAPYSYGTLDWAASLYYNIYEVTFSQALSATIPNVGTITINTPQTATEEPKDTICSGTQQGAVGGSFAGTPPDFLDYYTYNVNAGLNLGALYKITDYSGEGNEPERYIFLNSSGSFNIGYSAADGIIEQAGYVSMYDPGVAEYTVVIEGKTFWGYQIDIFGSGNTIPEITGVELYTYP